MMCIQNIDIELCRSVEVRILCIFDNLSWMWVKLRIGSVRKCFNEFSFFGLFAQNYVKNYPKTGFKVPLLPIYELIFYQ